MKKLIKAIENKATAEIATFETELNKLKNIPAIMDKWHYKQLLTPSALNNDNQFTTKTLKEYILKRYTKKKNAQLAKEITHIQAVGMANKAIIKITVSIEWKKSKMWGSNPSAEAIVRYEDGMCQSVKNLLSQKYWMNRIQLQYQDTIKIL